MKRSDVTMLMNNLTRLVYCGEFYEYVGETEEGKLLFQNMGADSLDWLSTTRRELLTNSAYEVENETIGE